VDVRVEEGREGVQPLRLDHFGGAVLGVAGARQLGDSTIADHDVVLAVDPSVRVEHSHAAQDQLDGLAIAPAQSL
jgi:hypothetical protein